MMDVDHVVSLSDVTSPSELAQMWTMRRSDVKRNETWTRVLLPAVSVARESEETVTVTVTATVTVTVTVTVTATVTVTVTVTVTEARESGESVSVSVGFRKILLQMDRRADRPTEKVDRQTDEETEMAGVLLQNTSASLFRNAAMHLGLITLGQTDVLRTRQTDTLQTRQTDMHRTSVPPREGKRGLCRKRRTETLQTGTPLREGGTQTGSLLREGGTQTGTPPQTSILLIEEERGIQQKEQTGTPLK
jgi:hypothetical protein